MDAADTSDVNLVAAPTARVRILRVTSVYSKDKTVSKAEGAWISGFLMNSCGDVLGDYDDLIIARHNNVPLHELRAAVCQGARVSRGGGGDGDDDDDDGGGWWLRDGGI